MYIGLKVYSLNWNTISSNIFALIVNVKTLSVIYPVL